MNRRLCSLFAFLCMVLVACSKPPAGAARREVILATTTSTQDSGLLAWLLPEFERSYGVEVKTIAVGTGEALALGERGDADVLLVHARGAEDEFMAKGHGLVRKDVMHNDFLIAGPPSDPAAVKGVAAADAMRKISDSGALFASRGDKSGTHKKEQELWKKAGVDPSSRAWYVSTGQGMGETLRIANEKLAYVIVDRGTWLTMRTKTSLVELSAGDRALHNPYGVIVVNPDKHPKVRVREAKEFADWLVSAATQKRIGEFGKDKYGQGLFIPDAVGGSP